MGQIIETKVRNFGGGIVNNIRDPREDTAIAVTNFDINTLNRLVPEVSTEDGDDQSSTRKIGNYTIGFWTPATEWRLFSLGVVSGTGRAQINMKQLDAGGSQDMTDEFWATPANNASSSGNVNYNFFTYYHRTGKIYGARAGTHFWAFTPDGSTAFNDTELAVSYSHVAQGLVHSKDDILYVPYYNSNGAAGSRSFIATNDAGSWTAQALTLPDHLIPTSIAEYGNYLAIACSPASGVGNSIVYLWDRDASLTTLSESVDWGTGDINVLGEIGGVLVGVSISANSVTRFDDRIIFRYLSGNKAVRFFELPSSGTINLLKRYQIVDNRIYFLLETTIDGEERAGMWSFGRSLNNSSFTLSHELTQENDTAIGNGSLQGFIKVNDFTFISYTNNAGTWKTSKTDYGQTYTATSIYEKLFNTVSSNVTKELRGLTITHAPLPAAGQVVVKYKLDEATSWTTLLTNTTDNSIRSSAINIESSGAEVEQYKEIKLRIESTGKAEITGIILNEETIDDDIYA